jgi:GNAT superfamily N-acetyltransferase
MQKAHGANYPVFGGPLADFTTAAAARVAQLENAEANYIASLGGLKEEAVDALATVHPQLRHPAFNAVFGLGLSATDPDGTLDRLVQMYERLGLPHQVTVSPTSNLAIAPKLQARGYSKMAERVWLEVIESLPPRPRNGALAATPTSDTRLWAATVSEAVGVPFAVGFFEAVAARTVYQPHHRLVLATVDGAPAGGMELTADEGVGFIRHLGVLPRFRGQGVALMLLHEACLLMEEVKAVRIATRAFARTKAVDLLERYGFQASHLTQDFVQRMPAFLMD